MLTEENVFNNEKYRSIALLLSLFRFTRRKYLRQAHLVELLVNNSKNNESKESLFTSDEKKFISSIPYLSNLSSIKCFKSKYGLRRALQRLKDLEIITSYKPKKSYKCLELTHKGGILLNKWMLLDLISKKINENKQIEYLLAHTYKLIGLEDYIKRTLSKKPSLSL